ncbi:MAG TPA: O-antigen ligase family protein [Devosiaceae bacterium]
MRVSSRSLPPMLFAGWLAMLCLPLLSVRDYWTFLDYRANKAGQAFQLAGLASFGLLVVWSMWRGRGRKERLSDEGPAIVLLVCLFLWSLLSTIWSINPAGTFAYSVVTYSACAGVLLIARTEATRGTDLFRYVPVMTIGFIFLAAVLLPFNGRTFGGIEPNVLGAITFCGLVLAQTYRPKLRWVVTSLFLVYLLVISSRTYFIVSVIFLLIHLAITCRPSRIARLVLPTAVAATVALLLIQFSASAPGELSNSLVALTHLDDADRGIGSGFTGRADLWAQGLQTATLSPWLGFGFRTRADEFSLDALARSAHNGYLNLVLDIGVVGLALFLTTLLTATYLRWRRRRLLPGTCEQRKLDAIFLAVTPPMLLVLFFEPTHLNLGLPHNILFLFVLFHTSCENRLGSEPNQAAASAPSLAAIPAGE